LAFAQAKMFTAKKKIVKDGDAPVDAFEEQVAQAIFDLQVQTDMKADLQDLFITSAKEVEVSAGRKAVIIHVPFRLLKSFHAIQQVTSSQLNPAESRSGWEVSVLTRPRA
jgi:small subunit ribosomal protein S7e